MRPAAEVEPFALRVEPEVLACGDGVDQLDLEGLALVLEQLLRAARGSTTSQVKGESRAMISRIFSSIFGRSSGVKGSSRAKS